MVERVQNLSESVELSDVIAPAFRVADTLGLSDTFAASKVRDPADSLGITDSVDTSLKALRLPDALGITDTCTPDLVEEAVPVEIVVQILDDTLDRAPTVLTCSVFQALANTDVEFWIGGVLVLTQQTSGDGSLYSVSLPIDDTYLAGVYTLSVMQSGATTGTATFTIAEDPIPDDSGPGSDVPPAEPNVVARWELQDPIAGGLGTFTFPANPESWVPPYFERLLTVRHTTARDGQYHVIEGQEMTVEWSFSGFSTTQALHDALRAFHVLNRRFYVIDHRGNAWVTTFVDVDLSPRTRKNINGTVTDWGHDYTVTAVAYSQAPAVLA